MNAVLERESSNSMNDYDCFGSISSLIFDRSDCRVEYRAMELGYC